MNMACKKSLDLVFILLWTWTDSFSSYGTRQEQRFIEAKPKKRYNQRSKLYGQTIKSRNLNSIKTENPIQSSVVRRVIRVDRNWKKQDKTKNSKQRNLKRVRRRVIRLITAVKPPTIVSAGAVSIIIIAADISRRKTVSPPSDWLVKLSLAVATNRGNWEREGSGGGRSDCRGRSTVQFSV